MSLYVKGAIYIKKKEKKGSKYKQILSDNIGVSLIIIIIITTIAIRIILIILIIYSFIHVPFVQTGTLSPLHKKNKIET